MRPVLQDRVPPMTSYDVIGALFLVLPFALIGLAHYGLGKRETPAPLFIAAVMAVVCFAGGIVIGVSAGEPLIWTSVFYGLRVVIIVPVLALFLGLRGA